MEQVKEYECLNCKGQLKFDPHTQTWKCQYCFSEFSREDLDKAYNKKEENLDTEMAELNTYHCKNCGAELVADSVTSATFCMYCKSSNIIKSRFSGKFKPEKVIPFKITKEDVIELYKTWINKRIF